MMSNCIKCDTATNLVIERKRAEDAEKALRLACEKITRLDYSNQSVEEWIAYFKSGAMESLRLQALVEAAEKAFKEQISYGYNECEGKFEEREDGCCIYENHDITGGCEWLEWCKLQKQFNLRGK